MDLDNPDIQASADLNALATAAHGRTVSQPVKDASREAKIAELKARYLAGNLSVDERALASTIIDSMLESPEIPFPKNEPEE